ncbi:hypothetical protein Q8A73_000614 [Channa argus]|nr:hypothetical protein Q8A73_000614 [Channa argus]
MKDEERRTVRARDRDRDRGEWAAGGLALVHSSRVCGRVAQGSELSLPPPSSPPASSPPPAPPALTETGKRRRRSNGPHNQQTLTVQQSLEAHGGRTTPGYGKIMDADRIDSWTSVNGYAAVHIQLTPPPPPVVSGHGKVPEQKIHSKAAGKNSLVCQLSMGHCNATHMLSDAALIGSLLSKTEKVQSLKEIA